MGKFLKSNDIKTALDRLKRSTADPSFFQYCILLAADTEQGNTGSTKINGRSIRGVVTEAARVQTEAEVASLSDPTQIRHFSPIDSEYKLHKFWSNGPSDTIPRWSSNTNIISVAQGVSPKTVIVSEFDPVEIRRFFKIQDANRVYFPDLAVWWFRHLDFTGVIDSGQQEISVQDISELLQRKLGLQEDELEEIFELAGAAASKECFELVETIADHRDYLPAYTPKQPGEKPPAQGIAQVATYTPALTQHLIDSIRNYGFFFEPYIISSFLSAVRAKPFVILTGISGTGKTHLPILTAKTTGSSYKVVPVKPDWTDSAELLGYTDSQGHFRPGIFLEYAKEAIANPDKMHFFILDEMNLGKVELYFADMLSKMETSSSVEDKIQSEALYPEAPPEYSTVYIPSNLVIVGSLNMDESTYSVSKKVLDRAFILDFDHVDLTHFGAANNGSEPQAQHWNSRAWGATRSLPLEAARLLDDSSLRLVIDRLERINKRLMLSKMHFGYRVRDEICAFILAARDQEPYLTRGSQSLHALDIAIYSKILPKIEGSDDRVLQVLEDLSSLFLEQSFQLTEREAEGDDNVHYSESDFQLSLEKISSMKKQYSLTHYCSFWS